MSNPQQSGDAGGESITAALSVIVEGAPQSLVNEVCEILAELLQKSGARVITGKELRTNDEQILLANQRFLDAAAITLAPETSSLFVALKLHPRLQMIQQARSKGFSVVQNNSWLSDAVSYQAQGNQPVVEHILKDFNVMRPDVWAVIDTSEGPYMAIAKRAGIKTYSSDASAESIANSIFDQILKPAPKKTQKNIEPVPAEISMSRLASIYLKADRNINITHDTAKSLDYYRPNYLGKKVVGAYETIMNKIISNHDLALQRVTKYLEASPAKLKNIAKRAERSVSGMLPVAIQMQGVPENNLPSERDIVSPPENKLARLIEEVVPQRLGANGGSGPNLVSAAPINELDLVPAIIFPHTNLNMTETRSMATNLPYDQKELLFTTFLSDKTGQLLKRVLYTWDIISEFDTSIELLHACTVVSASLQLITPRYGYQIPEIVEKAGAEELYQQSFDLSMELHSLLQAAGYDQEAQYAVLGGHRVRFEFVIDGMQLKSLLGRGDVSKNLKNLITEMHAQISEHHPLISTSLKEN